MTEKRNFFKFQDGKPVGAVIYSHEETMTQKRFTTDYNGDEHLFTHFLENGRPMTKEEVLNRLNGLSNENQRLKAQLSVNPDEGVCNICKYQELVPCKDIQGFYTAKCEKGYLQCSKNSLRYCEDFELKEII